MKVKWFLAIFIIHLICSCSPESGGEKYHFKLVEYRWYQDSIWLTKVLEKESDSTLRLMINDNDAPSFYRIPNGKPVEEQLKEFAKHKFTETYLSGITNEVYDGGYYFLTYNFNGEIGRFFFLPHYAPKELKLLSEMLDSLYFSPGEQLIAPFDFRKGLEPLYDKAKSLHPPHPVLDTTEFKPLKIQKS